MHDRAQRCLRVVLAVKPKSTKPAPKQGGLFLCSNNPVAHAPLHVQSLHELPWPEIRLTRARSGWRRMYVLRYCRSACIKYNCAQNLHRHPTPRLSATATLLETDRRSRTHHTALHSSHQRYWGGPVSQESSSARLRLYCGRFLLRLLLVLLPDRPSCCWRCRCCPLFKRRDGGGESSSRRRRNLNSAELLPLRSCRGGYYYAVAAATTQR